MVHPQVDIPHEELAALCRRHHIRRLALFGSVMGDQFGPASDIDVLVEFDCTRTVGFRVFRVEEELSQLFGGRRIDLLNPKYINHRLKRRILGMAKVLYEEG